MVLSEITPHVRNHPTCPKSPHYMVWMHFILFLNLTNCGMKYYKFSTNVDIPNVIQKYIKFKVPDKIR